MKQCYSVSLSLIYLTEDHLYVKAEVEGYDGIIIVNKILRVPYSSNVKIHCKGPGKLFWQYQSSKLDDVLKTVTTTLPSNSEEDNHAILTINQFDHANMGFYTCQNLDPTYKEKETMLITTCKSLLCINVME